ncbi:hypothetical protein PPTG_11582 [Phytophthora nicotianae INRA-310]|uniref:Uncharacterized protein n=1 Tax=Phytophthora nicotianae (strain INRA-310) TaxID=761204 RepID=W2Q6C5_PHYN3|nr:hypothetical protein PPTG_11582 [Phytophthora nicotianae INRA-310]ETN08753.1 hypothetical protein PPTG_11582 [Phytophthora nicotianae INRA-310]
MGRPTLERVHGRVVAGLPERVALLDSQPAASLLRQLTDTAIQEYMRSMKKAALLAKLRSDPALQARFQGLDLHPGKKMTEPGTITYGKVPIPGHDFERNRRRVSTVSYTSSPQLLAVLRRMYTGWDKTFQKLLLVQTDKDTAKSTESQRSVLSTPTLASQMPFRVLDFQALQAAHANKIAEILLVDWRRALVENIIDNLQDHFDLFLSDRVIYDSSRLKRVLTGLELRLAAQLREVVHRSVDEWVSFVRLHAENGALASKQEDVQDKDPVLARKSSSQFLEQKIRAPRSSLFSVQLAFVNDQVVVEPSAQDVTAALLEPLDAIATVVQEIDRLDCDIMGLLSLDRRPLLDFSVDSETGRDRVQKASRRAVVAECLDALQAAKVAVCASVEHAMQAAHALATQFAAYTDFVHFDASAFIAELQPVQQQELQLLKEDKTPEDQYLPRLCEQIRRFHELAFRVDVIAFDFVALPLVCVHTSALKKQLRSRSLELRDTLISSLVRDARAQNLAITARYAAILARINEKPTNEAQLARLKQFVGESKAVIAGIQREVAAIHVRLDALNEFSHKISAEDFTLAHSTKEWPLKVAHAADSCDSALEEDKVRMMDRLALEKEAFELDLERFEGEVRAFTRYGEVEHTDKYVELAVTLFDALQDARAKAQDFNAREAVFGFPPTEYAPLLAKLEGDFAPYYKLWTMSSEFHSSRQTWLNGPFLELKGGAIEALVTEWWKASYKLSKSLVDDAPGSAEVALILRERTEEFKAYLPVIQSLASPALQERHWEKLRHTIGFEESEEELTLQLLLDRGITQHLETIQEIGTFAEKEYSLQKNLSAMIAEWEKVEFQTAPYRETGTYLLRSTDDIVALLDDHLVKTQTMRGSPYIKSIEKDLNGIKNYVQVLNLQLEKIVMLVRGNLTKLERTTIGALVVIDVHARDTISHMIEKDVESDQDFEWISQLRYYWTEGVKSAGVSDLQARIVNARVRYGYEYLGNTMRLVITPLTDRCYRTMMGAVDLMYGGAPEGPAGTGKTETVKDLSKAIAIQCVVFNCSDGLDYLAMAKFFKGLAGCGSWCCFDEFNRINIEVLSVIAQQILTINEGKKAGVDKFLFEGTFIKLNASANVFITMNPGYAGRAELPDNLKALFRPCAMMVPDYALISEIRLYSFGFAQARSNARKLTQVLQLASEQLSSQKHYDYGMRAVNSILVATGALRQQLGNDPFWTEDKIVLRSVQDVNLPKFTSDDLPLFRGITSDLFPDVLLPLPDHGALLRHIDETCERGISIVPDVNIPLECKPEFKMKVVQFYETVQVRHGLMIVGTTGSGKTCVVHSLATAMTSCYNEEIETQEENGTKGAPTLQQRVNIHTMNPKAITSGQLYGNFDENTHEWSDGVLACTYRNCARDTSTELQWVMFDGPVDAVWIENMNTVLDDNKKLCLMSGEIVKMTERMRMVFETEDLEEASPATVSRVGMVFLEAKVLGWEVLVRTWLHTRLPLAFKSHSEYLEESFRWIVPPMLYFVDKHCTVPTPVTFLEHAASLLRLFECALRDGFPDPSDGSTTASSVPTGADAQRILECVLIKAVIWSIGACIDSKSRRIFDRYLRDFLSAELAVAVATAEMHTEPVDEETGVPASSSLLYFMDFVAKSPSYMLLPDRVAMLPIPEEGLVYDYRFDTRRCVWVNWMEASGAFVIPRDAQFTQVLVPTIDSERNAWLLDTLIRHHFHVLCTGDTGTGKSVSIKKKLLSGLNDPPGSDVPPKFASSIFLNFSAQTSANQTQDLIEAKLDKRRKGVLGPPLGQSCVIFVDDLNMPAKETYGAQPPIELLRQWMGHGGWYNRKDNSFTQLVDIQFIAAMGPPGGGRTRITQRYVRYFNLINFVPFDNDSLRAIFTRITDWFLLNFPQAVKQLGGAVVSATIDIYNTISQALLPTPAKSHYTFNLRDLSKVFQGVAQASSDTIKDGKDFVRLWSHECLRVFSDRLIDDKDRAWFADILTKTVKLHFDLQYTAADVRGPNATLIYGNFGGAGDGKSGVKHYAELRDREKLQNAMQVFLEDYNNMSAAPMRLVLFQNAIEHVARISRVIHQPLGNALLVGVGGSGRKSLTTLAVFMAEYKLFQIEISKSYSRTEWRNDIKKPLLKVATIETDALLETISREQKEANATKDIVGAEEKLCNEQAAEANGIKESCEAELAEAIPALENAVKALQTLTKGDITEIKAMKKPPDGVKLVMEAVCIMMRVPPVKVKDPAGGTKKVDDYWGPAQKSLLGDTRFLQNLLEYDKDNIPVEAMDKVRPYTANPDFQADKIRKASVAASGLCSWVHAMVVYDRVAKVVAPKREALKAATLALEKAQSELKIKQDALQLVLDKVARLEEDLAAAYKKKSDLEFQVDDCSKKLTRATQLIGGLGGEKARWSDMSAQLQIVYDNVVGDIMLASGVIAYLGAFTSVYRERAVDQWCSELTKQNITCSKTFTLTETLGEAVQIRAWTIAKLPNDSFSIDNAIMLQRSNRWPLMIDPQGQANRWVKNMEESNNLKVVKQSQAGFVRMLENSIMIGAAVLIENIPEEIDPMLEPILLKQVVKTGGVATIRLGDNTVEYDANFRLYMTTKLRNPHYPPETCVKVNLLNFMATEEGLQDQMLGIVVAKEEPVLEQQREKLVLEDAANKKTLKEIEDQILYLLQTAKGNILDDERLIETLGASKITANKIEEKVREAAVTQQMIAEKRQGYLPVAFRASQLFFCIADLTVIDPMYQYALEWFINLFVFSISRAESSSVLATRLDNLNDAFTFILYQNVCRSLFEKDKLLFAFLLAIKILVGNGTIDGTELRYFFTGNTQMDLQKPKPVGSETWLNDKTWANIVGLDALPSFTGFSDTFAKELDLWEVSYNATDPAETLMNISVVAALDAFQRIIVLRCIRPDKVIPAVMSFVATEMGQRFIEPQPFDLKAGFDDSNCSTPLIFVLTPGADPMSELLKLAAELGFNKKFVAISLGQGQGPLAENAIAEAIDNGTWVCLQNCHLSVSWLPTLEKICEEITPDRVHASFRLWLTSEPTRAFPSYILQHGVKMTNEPPKGMRANLKGSYLTIDEQWVASCKRPREFKKLLFGLCFFHAVVRERTKFGPLGWNISYVFSSSDLAISKDQLKISLDDLQPNDPIPYAALAYLAGECNYGGRVTDDKDRRCLITILSDFYTPDILSDNYTFSPSGLYYAPSADGSLSVFLNYIDQLPMNEGPEVFGLHDNANISTAIAETNLLLESALSLQPRGASGGGGAAKSWDEVLDETARDIAAKLPPLFDIEKAELAFPVSYSESMNTVLTQELGRFNRLLALLQISLVEIQKAIKGLVVMSAELEAMGNSMVNGHVPARWSAVAYPSLKPLGSWVTDFLARLAFLQNWITLGKAPPVYWISGFFFTQAFITGTQQNYARKHKLPIDQVGYDMVVLAQPASELTVPAEDGAYVDGLFLEGARWDAKTHSLAESRPRELYVPLPVLHLLPKSRDQIEPIKDTDPKGTAHVYLCPVYKTSKRQGTLSTTGHSTNFVMSVRLPMSEEHRQKHWIRRGVALLTQLDT